MTRIEPLFGGTDWITDAQRETVDKAAAVIRPTYDVANSEDDRGNGVLYAIFNGETPWGQPLAYKLEILPNGNIDRFHWDSIADPEEWDWDEVEPDSPLVAKLKDAGLTFEEE